MSLFTRISGVARRCSMILLACGLLAGCGMTELYAELDEQEGNEMLALLLEHNIGSEKRPGKDKMISLYVNSQNIPAAMELLRKNGYPKEKFSSISDLFNADKLIATPQEDRTRYIYGLSQELADTLSRVDGVMTARVHLVMPGQDEEEPEIPSAAVFIKHNPNYDMAAHIPQFKSIVASGIEGLDYEKVNVALFPATRSDIVRLSTERLQSIVGIELRAQSVAQFYLLFGAIAGVLLLSLGLNLFLFLRRGSRG